MTIFLMEKPCCLRRVYTSVVIMCWNYVDIILSYVCVCVCVCVCIIIMCVHMCVCGGGAYDEYIYNNI